MNGQWRGAELASLGGETLFKFIKHINVEIKVPSHDAQKCFEAVKETSKPTASNRRRP